MEKLIIQNNPYEEPDIINSTAFNQDISCFAAGTDRGFRIYNVAPFKNSFKRDLGGPINRVAMLNRCNIVALVGSLKNKKYPANKVLIWDDAQSKVIRELVLPSQVLNLKLKRDRLFIVSEKKIFVYSLHNFEVLETLETYENINGVIGLSNNPWKNVIAYPDKKKGHLMVKNYEENTKNSFRTNQSGVACVEVNYEGTLIASASEKGTLIRIYDQKGNLQQELRRGSECALIHSIAFDSKNKFIACSSDRGTIHIFFLNIKGQNGINQKTFIGKFTSLLGIKNEYLNSERSFAQLRLNAGSFPICAFGENDTIYAITRDGFFYQGKFDVTLQGDCTIEIQQPTNL